MFGGLNLSFFKKPLFSEKNFVFLQFMNGLKYIKPGLIIKILVEPEEEKVSIDMRGSIIYDVQNKELIVSQTDPQIIKNRIGQVVVVTFLAKERHQKTRYRFGARIEELIKNYKLSSAQTTNAIKLIRTSEPEEYNMRMSYRVELPTNSGIEIFINQKKVNVIDISLGGAKVSHTNVGEFDAGSMIKITLFIDSMAFDVEAIVKRKWLPQDNRFHGTLEFMSLEFIAMSIKLQNALARKILDIQRSLRYKELFSESIA